ncbi:helix-turn-helix transcriptional regulator [Paenibacillus sp. GD4]|uniref:helix-turn-helix domain-containing protein n=1 Tax=Paenibacillus TaxID=44249 RepID=UPI002543C74D|nr:MULTISPECIES: helix-turn-helix transcriptional regulator [Paenibacillus]MDQ1909861.1 helix-turn-helix transcriptional regulator [Paenibacillus sp. GD4]
MAQPIPDFGRFLESLRGSMSLREAAKKSGLSHAYIRDLELERNRSTNEKITPSPDTLKKLSVAYGYPYTELMIKAGHLMSEDVAGTSAPARFDVDLKKVQYIEIGTKDITYHMADSVETHSIDSLIDFSSFLDRLEEHDFKKVDADLYVNFTFIKKYDQRSGKLYFHESGSGKSVMMTAIRQKKYHDLLLRTVAYNTNSSLEFHYGRISRSASLSPTSENM